MAESLTRVAVVMGGVSSEHEVSLGSGANVCNGLPRERHAVKPVVIMPDNRWLLYPGWLDAGEKYESMPETVEPLDPGAALARLVAEGVECCFIALHGPGGEDGVIQGFFQTAGLAYTGSGVLGNAVGMDKIVSKRLARQLDIATAEFTVVRAEEVMEDPKAFAEAAVERLGLPCVAKVSNEGSSHNMGIAADAAELAELLGRISKPGRRLLLEEYLRGRELTCAVIDRVGWQVPRALPPTELVPITSDYFDYEAKYTPGATDEITPARIDGETTARVQTIALRCHGEFGCGGMSRTDMILGEDGVLYFLEINTIPGLTSTSLIPQAAKVAGIGFSELLEIQVEWAVAQRGLR